MSSYNFNAESKKYTRRINLESATEEDITGYIRFKIELYKREEWFDEDLWETFTYDFENFNLDIWKKVEKGILQSLRKTLRSAGVNVPKDEVTVWDALTTTVSTTKFPVWTEDQIKKSIKDKSFQFTSGQIQWLLENNFGQEEIFKAESANISQNNTYMPEELKTPTIHESSPQNSQPIPQKLNHQHSSHINDIGRQSGNLSRIYTEDMKYSGENDSFTYKLMIFNDNCSRAGVTEANFARLFPT
ncbi:hypothetical protein OnM2_062062, partial [Erysiphe neolycopersici]